MSTTFRADRLAAMVGDTDAFFADHWQRRPLQTRLPAPDAGPLRVTLHDIEYALSNPMLRMPFFVLMKDGVPLPTSRITRRVEVGGNTIDGLVDVEGVMSEFAAGATIVLRSAGEQIPSLGRALGDLADELGTSVIAHVFLTPGHAKGYGWHRDAEDVVIIQLHGEKVFEVATGRQILGERGRIADDEAPISPDEVTTFRLAPGDVLYLPSGCPHQAASVGVDASMHLSVMIRQTEWARLTRRALASALTSRPRHAPLRPTADSARAWLTELGVSAAEALTRLPALRTGRVPDDGLVAKTLRAAFPGLGAVATDATARLNGDE